MNPRLSLWTLGAVVGVLCSAIGADETSAPAVVTTNPSLAGDGVQVGIAKRDGVSISAGEAYVTRNGATEKLTKELLLPTGVSVRPDGTVTLSDKTSTTLRGTQLLRKSGTKAEVVV